MISRQRAIDVLYGLIKSDLLGEEVVEELQCIANCIEAEDNKLHMWDAPDEDYVKLNMCPCAENPNFEEFMAEVDEIYKRYKFTPSEFEQEDQ